MRRLLFKFWPFGVIILAVLVFFYPVWLQGKIPLPADFVVGTYYPWLDYKWGYPVGVPVKNPITTDVVSFIYPMRTYAIEILKSGNIPLWNPLILSSTPLLANFQSAPFSPTNIFYFIFGNLNGWSLQIIFQPLLASIFLYILLRGFGRSKLASVSGGLFFAFAGFSMIWMEWNAHSLVAAFFPLIFFLSLKWLKSGKWKWGLLLSGFFALQIFSGYPQIILYELLALILLVIFFGLRPQNDNGKVSFKKIPGLLFFIGLGIGLSAVQFIPALELIKLSQREVEDVINVSAFLPWQYLITFFAPDFFGNHSTGNFWGEGDYTLVTGYSGAIVIVFAGLGVITRLKEKNVRFGLSLIVLSLLLALPNPLSIYLKETGLFALQAASAHRALILSNLGIAILAAYGVDSLLMGRVKYFQILRAFYVPFIFIVGFGIATFYVLKVSAGNELLMENFKVALRNLILPFCLLSITFIMFIIIIILPKNYMRRIYSSNINFIRYKRALVTILVVLAISELFRFGWKFTPFSDKDIVFPKTPVLEFLQKQDTPFRVAAEDAVPINMMMPYKIQTIEGYDAVYPLTYAKYLSALNSGSSDTNPMGRYGSVDKVDSPLVDIANTKYILALKRDKNGRVGLSGDIALKFQKDYLRKIFEDGSVVILENTRMLDRVKMFYEFEEIKDDKDILNRLLDKSFPTVKKLILNKSPGSYFGKGINEVEFHEEPNMKIVKVETEKPGILFLGDSWYPGWKAYVDEKNTEILKADFNFMAIPLNAGNHEVIVKYEPESFKVGSIISVGSLTILILAAFSFKLRKWITTNH